MSRQALDRATVGDAADLVSFLDGGPGGADLRDVIIVDASDRAPIKRAVWERETLTDGSVVWNIVVSFDRSAKEAA